MERWIVLIEPSTLMSFPDPPPSLLPLPVQKSRRAMERWAGAWVRGYLFTSLSYGSSWILPWDFLCTTTNSYIIMCVTMSWVVHVWVLTTLQVFATSLCGNAPILLNSVPVLEEKLVCSKEFLSIGTCTFRIEYYSGFSPSPLREGNLLTTPREVCGQHEDQLCVYCMCVVLSTVYVLFCYRKLWSLPKLQGHPPLSRRARKTQKPLLRYNFYSRCILWPQCSINVSLLSYPDSPKWS